MVKQSGEVGMEEQLFVEHPNEKPGAVLMWVRVLSFLPVCF